MVAGAPVAMRIGHMRLEQIYLAICAADCHKVKPDGTSKYCVVNSIWKDRFYTLHKNRPRSTFLHFCLSISRKIHVNWNQSLTSPLN
jgi:hypothetical protein